MMYCDECLRPCMHCSKALEPHERACEDAARREMAVELRAMLTPLAARLSGTTALTADEAEHFAIVVEQAMALGEASPKRSDADG